MPVSETLTPLLLSLLRNIPGAVYRCGPTPGSKTEFVSEGVLELTGYAVADFLSGRVGLCSLVIPEDRESWDAELNAALAARRPYNLEYRIRTLAGEVNRVWNRGSGVFAADGTVEALEGFLGEAAGRKLSEYEFFRQQQRMQIGQAAARIIIMDWDVEADVLTWSDSPQWLRGPLPPGGKYPLYKDQVHPDDRERWLASREDRLANGGEGSIEYRLVRTDGQVRWLRSSGTVIVGPGGKPTRILSALHDVTERKLAEDALRESEARFRSLADLSADWYWEQDADLRFVSTSGR